MDGHLEGDPWQVGKKPHLQAGDVLVTPVVEGEEISLFASLVDQLANSGVVFGRQQIIGIQPEDPVTRRQLQRCISRAREIITPLEVPDPGTVLLGYPHGSVRRTGVDHHDLIRQTGDTIEACREPLFLVPHDHAQRQAAGCRRIVPETGRLQAFNQLPCRRRYRVGIKRP